MARGKRQFWTVGAGKGGVGKSFLTVSMGLVLARMGKSVILVDADLGSGNLHTFLGLKARGTTLMDVLEKRGRYADALTATSHPGLSLLSCTAGDLGTADPTTRQKQQMIELLSELDADHILVDLGAGTSFNVLDLFNITPQGIVVAAPDPASLQNAYGFIKNAIFRRIQVNFGSDRAVASALEQSGSSESRSQNLTMLDFYDLLCATNPHIAEKVSALVDSFRPLIVINMAASEQDQQVAEILQSTCKKFLNVDIRFCGVVVSDMAIRKASLEMSLLNFNPTECRAATQIQSTVERLLNCSQSDLGMNAALPKPTTPTMGLNDNLDFMGRRLHIQTEDMGYAGRLITTQVFCNGKVILSTKAEYPTALCSPGDRGRIADLMRKQHFGVISDLEAKMECLLRPPATQ